jgi:flagellar biosynthetic protein FlhB
MSASDKTEKATPKKKADARKQGQVARSQDINGAVVMLAGIFALGATGPGIAERLGDVMRRTLMLGADPEAVRLGSIGTLFSDIGTQVALSVAPIVAACMVAGIVASVAQVGLKPTPMALQPKPQRLNPVSGFKQIMGPHAIFETGKNIVKIAVVAVVVLTSLLPHLPEMASMVGMSPIELGTRLVSDIHGIALRAAAAYLVIGFVDYLYQRWRTEKSMRMDKQEVRDESKGQDLPAEVRGAIRRRQMQASRARMMEAVPTADVVITNPTHFSVALRYDGSGAAPEVVAKGQDVIALRIRELAAEHGVPVIPEPPLARSLYASCEVGDMIPEELFAAVAQVLAYVYRVAGRRKVLSA